MPDGAETITDADLSRLQNPKFHFEKNLRFQSSKNNMDLNAQILDFESGGYAQMSPDLKVSTGFPTRCAKSALDEN